MQFSAAQIAQLINGQVEGDSAVVVSKLSKIEEGSAGSLTFLANPQYTPFIYTTDASIVIVRKDFKAESPIKPTCTLIRVDDPYSCFAKLLEAYNQVKYNKTGVEQPSFVSSSAKTGENIYIGAFAYIGNNTSIGSNVKIFSISFNRSSCSGLSGCINNSSFAFANESL